MRYIYILKHRENEQMQSHIRAVFWYLVALAYITFAKTYEAEDLLGNGFGIFGHWLLRASRLMIFDLMRMDEDCFKCFNRCEDIHQYNIFQFNLNTNDGLLFDSELTIDSSKRLQIE